MQPQAPGLALNAQKANDTGGPMRQSARRTLENEAAALTILAESLDTNFDQAIALLHKLKGRVIVTGMGKSGHIARKIAATFASTGTPAFFVHPAEASHGDLGMLTPQDGVIALSNSGETRELADIVDYCRRFSLPLIAITSRPHSSLGERADITLRLPNVAEACPMGLAPTTSTTLMLALGDALAIALLEQNGFGAQDFRQFHPGGKLGAQLRTVAELMHKGEDLPLILPDQPMSQALLMMSSKGFGCVAVTNTRQELLGIITDGDLRRHMGPHMLSLTAEEVMTRNPKTLFANALAAQALALMDLYKIASLLITEEPEGKGKVVGLLQTYDCLRAGLA
jgi:arabinose-5-phosphate isomerase